MGVTDHLLTGMILQVGWGLRPPTKAGEVWSGFESAGLRGGAVDRLLEVGMIFEAIDDEVEI